MSAAVPIVALTGNALAAEAAQCRVVGMDDFATRSVTLAGLRSLLDRWLAAPLAAVP